MKQICSIFITAISRDHEDQAPIFSIIASGFSAPFRRGKSNSRIKRTFTNSAFDGAIHGS
jgi:hypothetical protein